MLCIFAVGNVSKKFMFHRSVVTDQTQDLMFFVVKVEQI